MSKEGQFFVGDSDLKFLGMAAALAARSEARRKGDLTGGLPGYARGSVEAIELLLAGLGMGATIPLDDVPELRIVVMGDDDAIKRLLDMTRSPLKDPDWAGFDEDEMSDDDEDDEL